MDESRRRPENVKPKQERQPVEVYMACVSLQLRLAGAGIVVTVEPLLRIAGIDARVCVAAEDVEPAMPMVQAFRNGNGR
jgi:hypothetical protein